MCYTLRRTLSGFRAEGNWRRTFARKLTHNLLGWARIELRSIQKYIKPDGLNLNVGCGRTKIKHCVGIDNLEANFYAGWEAKPDIIADVLRLPIGKNCVDTIIASHIWEYIYPPHRFLDEMYRVLRPGGHLCVILPNYDYLGHVAYYRDPTHKWVASPRLVQYFSAGALSPLFSAKKPLWTLVQLNRLSRWHYHWAFDVVLRKR